MHVAMSKPEECCGNASEMHINGCKKPYTEISDHKRGITSALTAWRSTMLAFFSSILRSRHRILQPHFITVMRQSCMKTRLDYLSLNSQDPLMWTNLALSLHKWKHINCKIPLEIKRKKTRNTRPRCLQWPQQRFFAGLQFLLNAFTKVIWN